MLSNAVFSVLEFPTFALLTLALCVLVSVIEFIAFGLSRQTISGQVQE